MERQTTMTLTFSTLLKVIEGVYWKGQVEAERRRPMKVGEAYESLPEELKKQIQNLKSDDFRNIRPDAVTWMTPSVHKVILK